ncbi:MAG: hypothetical protein K2N35_11870 [Muribaculaceae bacterium]|nr:hypothetical protein [Muribaculaceae bacterium]
MDAPQPFAVSRNIVFMTLLANPSTGLFVWIILIIGLVFIVLGCFADVRFLILGLIICLTGLPAMAFFAFAKYMFASDMLANLLHHTVERHGDGYLLRIYRPANQDEPIEADKNWIESGKLTFSDSNIVKKKTIDEYEVIFFKDSPLRILYVPSC